MRHLVILCTNITYFGMYINKKNKYNNLKLQDHNARGENWYYLSYIAV